MRVQGEALRAGLIGEPLSTLLGGGRGGEMRLGMLIEEDGAKLRGEYLTHLTLVALEVIVLVHGHDPEDLLAALRHTADKSGFFWHKCV